MLRWVKEVCFGSEPVEFVSAFGLEESLERLKAATRRSVFSALARQEAVGTVKSSFVSLQRAIPMVGNSFKPFFRGRFIEKDGKLILAGRFTMHWLVKVFLLFWFACVLLFTLGSAASFMVHPGKAAPTPLFGFGMLAFAVALVTLGRWFARNDSAWLSDVIQRALAVAPVQPAGAAVRTVPPRQPSAVPTYAALFLAVMGLFSCGMGVLGVQSYHTGPQGPSIAYFHSPMMRYEALVWGLVLLGLAYGIYRRALLAWRSFLLMIGASWLYSMINMLATPQPVPAATIAFIGVGGGLVTFIWGRWWYAQREHFHE
jgi:hypothetical protein